MKQKENKILILSNHNPLNNVLSGLSIFTKLHIEIKEYQKNIELHGYSLIISMAYHRLENVYSMDALKLFYETYQRNGRTVKPKFIFLSWFHPIENVNNYSEFFSAEKGIFEIMNARNCHLIQLPFTESTLSESVKNLLNLSSSD
jgi:hypothetical protein